MHTISNLLSNIIKMLSVYTFFHDIYTERDPERTTYAKRYKMIVTKVRFEI